MELGKAEVDADSLGMADVEEAVGFRGESRDHGLYRSLFENLVEETDLENRVLVHNGVLLFRLGFGRILRTGGARSGGSGLCLLSSSLLRSFLGALLQFVLRNHLTRHIVEYELGRSLGDGGSVSVSHLAMRRANSRSQITVQVSRYSLVGRY
ncbi:hypothetical protein RRF57_009525 [Xylaria bambusicola]|uniref:Uncharacterized protein n=1 Tax=Xylaria bambusicola TaxID=326684 RepID=A0AAN7UVQ4_9PEZI